MPGIMIVDDDVIIAQELEEILTCAGYDVVKIIYTAEAALESAKELRTELSLKKKYWPMSKC